MSRLCIAAQRDQEKFEQEKINAEGGRRAKLAAEDADNRLAIQVDFPKIVGVKIRNEEIHNADSRDEYNVYIDGIQFMVNVEREYAFGSWSFTRKVTVVVNGYSIKRPADLIRAGVCNG